MADRYEPRLSVRPLSERKQQPPAGEEDPLAELARIVTGRSTFDPAPPQKNKTVPVTDGDGGASLAADLETELLNDLQASFTVVRDPVSVTPVPPPPLPAAAPPATMQPAMNAAPLPALPPARTPQRDPALTSAQPRPAPAYKMAAKLAPANPPPAEVTARVTDRRERAERTSLLGRSASGGTGTSPASPPRDQPPAREVTEDKPARRLSLFRPRSTPTTAAEPPPVTARNTGVAARPAAGSTFAPPRPSSSRWEPPADDGRTAAEVGRYAPPRAAAPAAPPSPIDHADALEAELLADAPAFAGDEVGYDPDFPLDGLEPPQGLDEEYPPFPEEEHADLSRRRSNRAVVVIGALVAVVLIGGLGLLMLKPGSAASGKPPVIAADASPSKVQPAATQSADADQPNKLIYDRVEGGNDDAGGDSKLVTSGNEQIASIPSDQDNNNPISRVIMPAGPGFDNPPTGDANAAPPPAGDAANTPATAAAPDANAAAAGDAAAAAGGKEGVDGSQIGPRKVRTVVVRPDGTIISSEAAPAADGTDQTDAAGALAPADAAAQMPQPTKGTDINTVLNDKGGESIPVNTDPLANADSKSAAAAAAAAAQATAPPAKAAAGTVPASGFVANAKGTEPIPTGADATATATPAPPPKPQVKPAQKPTVVATVDDPKGPVDLTPGKSTTKTPRPQQTANAAAPAGAGALVQVSAQKSDDAARASYKDLQTRFPQILARYQPNILKVDLGDRGVFYRVRVGPFSSSDAQHLCDDLKAAGGDCLIAH